MSQFDDFYTYAVGKVWDTNGNQQNITSTQWSYPLGGQCVSLAKTYLKYLGYGIRDFGNAKDWWTNRKTNGILDICYEVSVGKQQNGDIGVSSALPASSYGHIFIYRNGQAFNQNYMSQPQAQLSPLSGMGTIYGYLRPKCLGEGGTPTPEYCLWLDIVCGIITGGKIVEK